MQLQVTLLYVHRHCQIKLSKYLGVSLLINEWLWREIPHPYNNPNTSGSLLQIPLLVCICVMLFQSLLACPLLTGAVYVSLAVLMGSARPFCTEPRILWQQWNRVNQSLITYEQQTLEVFRHSTIRVFSYFENLFTDTSQVKTLKIWFCHSALPKGLYILK